MRIEILGPGCARCQRLAENAKAAMQELGLEGEIVKVTDLNEIVSRGVMTTPALAVDGSVKTIGSITSVKEIRALLTRPQDSRSKRQGGSQ